MRSGRALAHPVPELAVALEVVPLLLLLRLLALAAEALALRTPSLVTPSVAGPALEPLLLEAPLPVLRPDHRAVVDEVEGVLLRRWKGRRYILCISFTPRMSDSASEHPRRNTSDAAVRDARRNPKLLPREQAAASSAPGVGFALRALLLASSCAKKLNTVFMPPPPW